MTEPIKYPWKAEYEIEETVIMAETGDLRVLRITLAEGQFIPWHFHTNVTDTFTCIEGTLRVETRAPRDTCLMQVGEGCAVPSKTAHLVTNAGTGRCRFIVVQGVGSYDYIAVGTGDREEPVAAKTS